MLVPNFVDFTGIRVKFNLSQSKRYKFLYQNNHNMASGEERLELKTKRSWLLKMVILEINLIITLSSLAAIYPAIKVARSQTGNVLRAEP